MQPAVGVCFGSEKKKYIPIAQFPLSVICVLQDLISPQLCIFSTLFFILVLIPFFCTNHFYELRL